MEIIILSLVGSFLLTYIVKWFAIHKSIVDIPNARSSHTKVTPRGGGIAIVISWFAGLIYLVATQQIPLHLFFALGSSILLFITSVVDDIYSLRPQIRLIAQSITVSFALYFIKGIPSIDFGFFVSKYLYLNTFIGFIALIWFINLFNFLDGIDGYASTETILVTLIFYFIFPSPFLLLLMASTLGFLIWNWQPAKIFMGDAGSTVLGFTIGILSIYFAKTENISIFTLLIPTSLFWFDATLTLFRRWRKGEKLSEAHKKHAYQRLVQSGFSHQKVVLWSIALNVLLFGLSLLAFSLPKFVLLFLLVDIIILYSITRWIDKRKAFV